MSSQLGANPSPVSKTASHFFQNARATAPPVTLSKVATVLRLLWLVIDETALRRPAATTGSNVMRAQIGRMIEACPQPNITVQILR